MKLTKFRIFLGLTLGYAILIFYLSSISDLNLPRMQLHLLNDIISNLMHSDYAFLLAPLSPLILQQDKVLHIILFFGFGLLIYLTLRSSGKTVVNAFIFAILLGSLYGVSDEFHQMFVPHRTASAMDLTADITGILFAQLVIVSFYILKKVYVRIFEQKE